MEILELAKDRTWLALQTSAIAEHWRDKNLNGKCRLNGLAMECGPSLCDLVKLAGGLVPGSLRLFDTLIQIATAPAWENASTEEVRPL